MIPAFTISYGVVAAMSFTVNYSIYTEIICIIAFFTLEYLNYQQYSLKVVLFLQGC